MINQIIILYGSGDEGSYMNALKCAIELIFKNVIIKSFDCFDCVLQSVENKTSSLVFIKGSYITGCINHANIHEKNYGFVDFYKDFKKNPHYDKIPILIQLPFGNNSIGQKDVRISDSVFGYYSSIKEIVECIEENMKLFKDQE